MHRIFTSVLVATGLVLALPQARGDTPPPTAPPDGEVLVLEIKGPIDEALTYIVRRAVQQAGERPTAAIVLAMDTNGGDLNACRDIVALLQKSPAPVYTFVERAAYSAGALIALSSRRIYMAPGSVIGDAMAILVPPMGGPQAVPEDLREKLDSGTSAFARATAETAGHDPEVAEAFVRRNMELSRDGAVLKPDGQLLTLTDQEAARMYGDPPRPLLSAGTVRDLDELLEREGLAAAPRRVFEVTLAERLARFIKLLAPLFLLGGLLGVYIEVKTPGFGLPGALGIACLAVFFAGHHIAGLAGWEDVALFTVGLILLAVEVFVLPGFGVAGASGLALMALGALMAMAGRAPDGAWWPGWPDLQIPFLKLSIAVSGTAIVAVALGRWLPHAPGLRRLILTAAVESNAGLHDGPAVDVPAPGAEGIAESELRPSGVARLNGRRVDVVTEGVYVPGGARVRVVALDGNRIVVAPIPADEHGKQV
jgi:membrane-bound serine protease (ClpP class)